MPDDHDDPRARVLARWPGAYANAIRLRDDPDGPPVMVEIWGGPGIVGFAPTEAAAWADAAGRL